MTIRTSILAASVLAFASLVLGGCAGEMQEPSTESSVTSEIAKGTVAEPTLRDGVTAAPAADLLDEVAQDHATTDGDRFDVAPHAGVGTTANAADTKRDMDIEKPAAEGLFVVGLDGAFKASADREDIQRKARVAK